MTAFSRQSSQTPLGSLTWELRTVNHRFLDLSIRLPESLRALEPIVRERLSEKLHRGKIEATLRLSSIADQPAAFSLNETLLKQLATASQQIQQYFPTAQSDLFSILSWPGVLETHSLPLETLSSAALELLQLAVTELVVMRQQEGSQIKTFIQHRLEGILAEVAIIQQQIPQLLGVERDRMGLRIAEMHLHADPQRLEQEMAILIQKTDVAEEIQRLITHCQAMTAALSQPGAMGRRLDFLSQELHREANTLSSKALAVSLTHASVEMKVLIEQIREQVQNIE